MIARTNIIVYYLCSFRPIIRWGIWDNHPYIVFNDSVRRQNCITKGYCFYVFYSVSYKLSDRIVIAIFLCVVCDSSTNWIGFLDMATGVYSATNVRVVLMLSSVFLIQALSHCLLQKCWEEVQKKVKNVFLCWCKFHIEEIRSHYFLQYLM